MSSEVQLNSPALDITDSLGMGSRVGLTTFDRVLVTAEDRPVDDTLPAMVDPAADHLDPEIAQRRADVDAKHRKLIAFLDLQNYEAMVLTRADSIAWFTGGGDLGQDLASEGGSVALYINRTTRAVLSDNVQSARIFEEELAGLGFQLKERPWHHDPSRFFAELTYHKRTATDGHLPGLACERERLRALRCPMTKRERASLRTLGRTLTLAVEATCRNFMPGETEADVAGHLAHRLIREGVVPIDLRVAADDRLARYRQPIFKSAEIHRRATITATGKRHGLCASVTRTVSFGPVDQNFREAHTLASMVDATYIYFSRPGEPIAEIFRRARRIYEKFDIPMNGPLATRGPSSGTPLASFPIPRLSDPSPGRLGPLLEPERRSRAI